MPADTPVSSNPPAPARAPALEEQFRELRQAEFSRLDAGGEVYLDHTGSALYLASHLAWHTQLLAGGVFGNPHAENPASSRSTAWGDAARDAVLALLEASPSEYEVIFTANASAATKLVAESFAFGRRSRLVLAADNHNSVLGLREFARRKGAVVRYIPLDEELRLRDVARHLSLEPGGGPHLLAFPAQSNFSGVRHPLALVRLAQGLGFSVLLDAAAYLPTAQLSLRTVPADFVTLSLYKITGYPTGVGALVARRSALEQLQRPWFAGGTVEFSSVQNDTHLLRAGAAGFEDGTPNFLALSAIPEGLRRFQAIGVQRIGAHVQDLTGLVLGGLATLRHRNGRRLVVVHGPATLVTRGGTVSFTLVDRHGRWIPHWDVERSLATQRIAVRSGCFCNPGAAERAFAFEAGRVRGCLAGTQRDREPFSLERFARCMDGGPVGAIRASVGMATSQDDVERFLGALERWTDGPSAMIAEGAAPDDQCA